MTIEIDPIDRDALERALEIARRDPGRAEQLDSMMEDREWLEVAEFAAFCVQGNSLRLRPWEVPPCEINADDEQPGFGRVDGAKLLRRLLDAGLSRFEPDPVAALRQPSARSVRNQ